MADGQRRHEGAGVGLHGTDAGHARNRCRGMHAGLAALGSLATLTGFAGMAIGRGDGRLMAMRSADGRFRAMAVGGLLQRSNLDHRMGCARSRRQRRAHAGHRPADPIQHQGEDQEDAQGQGGTHDRTSLARPIIRG